MKRYSIHVIFALLLLIMSAIGGRYIPSAFADTDGYTTAIEDLQHDETFKPSAYPDNPEDIKIQLIQIAESEDGDLFVYTYQPCQRTTYLVATDINMSLSETVDDTELYPLRLINISGTLCKYSVTGVTVSPVAVRYYNITSIYREWIKGVDEEPDNDNTTNAVAHEVGQLWQVKTSSDGVEYSMTETEFVTVTAQMIGFRRYSDGFQWSGTKSCDAHYMLFNCDHDIDKLISADVAFNTQEYKSFFGDTKYYDKTPQTAYLRYDDQVSNDGSGWFGKKEKWRRMASTSEFMQAVKLRDDEQKIFNKYAWVLNFYETEYKCEAGGKDVLIGCLVPFGFVWAIGQANSMSGTIVSDVTLLRLEFEYDGHIYDLGVVSNKQTGSSKPTNGGFDFFDWLADALGIPVWAAKTLFFGVLALVVLGIALPVLSLVSPVVGQVLKTVFGAVWTGVVWLVKGILWLLLLPFKGIAALVRKIKNGKDGAA